jgi:hypothetical protein
MSSLIVAPAVLAHLEPLEGLVLPFICPESVAAIGPRACQVAANDDRSAVLAWLARYKDSPATLASYRKEAERLLLWCVHQHGKALSDLTHEDFLAYESFWKIPNRLIDGSCRSLRRRRGPRPTGVRSPSRWTGRASARHCRSSTASSTGWFKPGIWRATP